MSRACIATSLLVAFFFSSSRVLGQDDAQPEVRERTIYVPFEELRDAFEKKGRGVFLPYEEFQELWKKARAADAPARRAQAPTGALITEIDSVAEMSDASATVRATLSIDLLRKGWQRVSLRLADAAILSARIDDQPARLVFDPQAGYVVLLKNASDESKRVRLELVYAKAISKSPGRNEVSFQSPTAPVNRWRIRVPDAGVKINVHPLIAATEAPAEEAPPASSDAGADPPGDGDKAKDDENDDKENDDKEGDDNKDGDKEGGDKEGDNKEGDAKDAAEARPQSAETVLLAFVGAAPMVAIDWAPKAEGAAGLAALASVQAQHAVMIEEGVVRTRTQLTYAIRRAELRELVIEAPADHKVAGVFDANVRQWDVVTEGPLQVITVQLFEPATAVQSVTVELEKFVDEAMQSEMDAPLVKARGVSRQQGVVVVSVASGLRADPQTRSGLLQLDANEVPAELKNRSWLLAYRYAALPFTLRLRVEKLTPRIETTELVEAYLEPERITLNLLALYEIERVGVFQFSIRIPEGWQVRSVRGKAVNDWAEAAYDSYEIQGEEEKTLQVSLSQRALGRVGLLVELFRDLDDPNLRTPTDETSTLSLPAPRAVDAYLEHATRRMVVYSPESLRVTPQSSEGAQGAPIDKAFQQAPSVRENRFPELRPIQAYICERNVADVQVDVQRRRPQISVAQLMRIHVDSGVVNYSVGFDYDIRFSGVKTLRIDAPEDVIQELASQSGKGRPMEPQPANVAEGYVAWEINAETEFLGNHRISFTWVRKIDQLEVGSSITLEAPVLRPQGADRAWGQVVLLKDETLDLAPAEGIAGLRPIDPRLDLMPLAEGTDAAQAARAYEFHDDWRLVVEVTRYELQDVKRTSIESAVVRMVVTRSDQLSVQAIYRVRSARQRLVVRLPENVDPEKAFDTQPLRINGLSVSLERGEPGEYYIPLAGKDTDEPFLLELRYTMKGDHRRLALPSFPTDPAVQKVHLCVYLPRERVLIGTQGDWTDHQELGIAEALATSGWRPEQEDQYLIDELTSGLEAQPGADFATDGTLYVFSALRPTADDDLRLTAIDRTWLAGWLILALGVLALVFLFRPIWQKLTALIAVVAGFVLIGAFLPTFFRQLADERIFAGIGLVVLLWAAQACVAGLIWFGRLSFPRRRSVEDVEASAESEDASQDGSSEQSGQTPFSDSESGDGVVFTGESGEGADVSADDSAAPDEAEAERAGNDRAEDQEGGDRND